MLAVNWSPDGFTKFGTFSVEHWTFTACITQTCKIMYCLRSFDMGLTQFGPSPPAKPSTSRLTFIRLRQWYMFKMLSILKISLQLKLSFSSSSSSCLLVDYERKCAMLFIFMDAFKIDWFSKKRIFCHSRDGSFGDVWLHTCPDVSRLEQLPDVSRLLLLLLLLLLQLSLSWRIILRSDSNLNMYK